MYYVLFHYTEGLKAKDFYASRSEDGVIKFLNNHYEGIEIIEIIEVKATYRLGLIVTEEYVKSALEPVEETESLVQLGRKPGEILKEKKRKLKELEAEEPSDMLEVPGDTEEEREEAMTPEKRTKKSLDDADGIIEREKKRQEQKKKGWGLCIECNSNRVAPWNKKKICSTCQNKRKTTRPHSKSKEFSGL